VFGEFAALFEFPFLRLEAMPRLDDSAKSCVFTRRLNGALLVFVEVRVGKGVAPVPDTPLPSLPVGREKG
jgi:hypothetical protein